MSAGGMCDFACFSVSLFAFVFVLFFGCTLVHRLNYCREAALCGYHLGQLML